MNKKLQDKAWTVLPNDFRERVKDVYKVAKQGYEYPASDVSKINSIGAMQALEALFGKYNLTSDTEGEEMLIVPRKQIQNWYQEYLRRIDILHGCSISISEIEEVNILRARCALLTKLFGNKCLPDKN